jgi:hypothetical protein
MKRHFSILTALIAVLVIAAPYAAAQESTSTAAAAALTQLMEARKLEAIAARDPEQPGRYFAALYIPGSQLLVISSPYPVPALLDKRIAEGKYMDVYLDINGAPSHQGQFFVMDSQADGLRRVCEQDQPFDSTSRNGTAYLSFDGKWDAQQLTEEQYNARFVEDDARYAAILKVLAGSFDRTKTLTEARRGSE